MKIMYVFAAVAVLALASCSSSKSGKSSGHLCPAYTKGDSSIELNQ